MISNWLFVLLFIFVLLGRGVVNVDNPWKQNHGRKGIAFSVKDISFARFALQHHKVVCDTSSHNSIFLRLLYKHV